MLSKVVYGDTDEPNAACNGNKGPRTPESKEERPLRDLFTFYEGKQKARHGWRMEVMPFHEALSTFEFDAIIDATGKSSCCLSAYYFSALLSCFTLFFHSDPFQFSCFVCHKAH
ncbi:unnamed protein product [Hydatigera taeniaeformis]|uniref:Pyr_redox_2 domain-containing protein n=1 Tax=Hydatigena taeniaeformis TaxID=6205 RepID=A0A0R3X8P7_HYDTA|nr:unnamed protein product [Hydatigera taeniaeformis]